MGIEPARTYAREKVKNLETSPRLTLGWVPQIADIDPFVADQLEELVGRIRQELGDVVPQAAASLAANSFADLAACGRAKSSPAW